MKDKSSLRYFWVTLLNIIITVAEFIGGAVSGSLALLSDAVHNLSDVGSIILAFVANLIAKRKRNNSKTFGYDRAEILAAFTNGIILIVISCHRRGNAVRYKHPDPHKCKHLLVDIRNFLDRERFPENPPPYDVAHHKNNSSRTRPCTPDPNKIRKRYIFYPAVHRLCATRPSDRHHHADRQNKAH